jgi:Ca2+:H+ antiporter
MSEKTPFIKTIPKLAILLLLLPVAVGLHYSGNNGLALFVVSALAILGTVTLIGKATEQIAVYAGPLWGGLLNATFGNVTELIIALFALQKGLHAVVLSSITGSILGNLLLVLGAAMIYGGTKFKTQKVSKAGAQVNVGMLWIAILVIMVPSLMNITIQLDPKLAAEDVDALMKNVSLSGAFILLGLYFAGLVFSMKTHKFLFMPGDDEQHTAEWSKRTAICMLLGATLVVAWLSELFVGSIDELVHSGTMNMSEMFIGVIVVALVGNAAEGSVAIWVARENKMELSFQIAMGSCLQVAMMVAPILVIASCFMGKSGFMPLQFNPFELLALFAATMIASTSLNDGETNWLEGTMLVSVYIFFALVFWFHP